MKASPVTPLLTGFPAVLDRHTSILLLGSFPGEASFAAQQYYAHPQNQFWRLMGELLGEPLAGLPYAERCAVLLRHRVGVWDVYRHCRREGALDAAIEDAELNDFSALLRAAPCLGSVLFNGQEAARSARRLAHLGLHTEVVPSTSPAYTLPFASKVERWRAVWPRR